MEPESPLPLLLKLATCHYTESCRVTSAVRKKLDVIVHEMESQMVINISEYHAAEFYGKTEVQVFPKQLKQ
jgi:hypothetical protein